MDEVIVLDSDESEHEVAQTSYSSHKSMAHCAKEGALSTSDNQGEGGSTSADSDPWHHEGSEYIGKRVLWPAKGCPGKCPSKECPGHCGTVRWWLPADKADFQNEAGEVRYISILDCCCTFKPDECSHVVQPSALWKVEFDPSASCTAGELEVEE
eukprot:2054804-Rhodomonas_salina.1